MVFRDPELAKKMYPFKKRLGIDDIENFNGRNSLKIDDRFLMNPLPKKDEVFI